MRRIAAILSLALVAMPARAEVPRVVTDIPPVHALAAAVMGDLGAPDILLDKGADPHHFQLRPSQARALEGADLVVWVGPRLTPWLDRAIDGVGLSGASIELISAEGMVRRDLGEDNHDHDHDHDHDQAEAGHDEPAHDGTDPHAWLDPGNARRWVEVIAAALTALDPDNAAAYAANADAARAAIEAAEAEARGILAPVADAPVMVFHDAYGYFADHFGVNVVGAIALGDAARPGAGRLRALRDTLQAAGAVCIFPEAQHDPAYVAALVDGTGVRVGAPLDPSGSTLDYGPALYGALLVGMAGAIADCVTGTE
ncbi:zinc transport system substrate-binding protein [Rhodovulum iodosum]|uniref:High-affinity zinc uptake system protein ZnuA n=1 Tax=Rhodovulum iodosum TaxID=68291 RepID=A0ABV3XPX6_9RHOB|nr:zinc ABC transporter substrate-binding protein [Rhodovulum robiginosum]RSK31359.1 zinc ABC transporter substrate-binding protein [Rhodovulum robiginosum]